MENMRLFCLPYAGGTKTIYNDWIEKYRTIAEVIPLEYSGHGSRFGEPLYTRAEEIADDIFKEIVQTKPQNYLIFGHSMGSLIALLVTERLEKEYPFPPKLLIIGGTRPPHLIDKDEKYTDLPKEKVIEKLAEMGQTDEELMNNEEFVELLYAIFYADLCISENYAPKEQLCLKTPMLTMTGLQDEEAPVEDMREWARYTENDFQLQTFDDAHFFPFTCNTFHRSFFRTLCKVGAS